MGFRNIKAKERGFTIVELLIVVVVIGILAAITIVAYNGVTNRARTASAQSAAASVQKKAELYNSDGPTGKYPAALTDLTSAAADTTYALNGLTIQATAPTASNGTDTVQYLKCAATAVNQAAIDDTNVTGAEIYYFDFTAGAVVSTPLTVGVTDGDCPAS